MKTFTVAQASRNFGAILSELESQQEDIVLVRNRLPVARLVPEPAALNALEVLGDLYRSLDDETADALIDAIKTGRKVEPEIRCELRNPWAS